VSLKISGLDYNSIPSRSGAREAVLLLVHGRGGNKRLLEFYAKRLEIPDLGYICLQAPIAEQREDQIAHGVSGWSWYLSPGYQGLDESRGKLFSVVEELQAQNIDPEKIFWLGFSQGGAMGLDLFLRYPKKLGGVICISGLLPRSKDYPAALSASASEQRILITHGTRDDIIPLEKAEETFAPLRAATIPFEFKVYDKPHSFHLQQEVPYLEETLKGWVKS
jgi:phospholipase/carboxylesterase